MIDFEPSAVNYAEHFVVVAVVDADAGCRLPTIYVPDAFECRSCFATRTLVAGTGDSGGSWAFGEWDSVADVAFG